MTNDDDANDDVAPLDDAWLDAAFAATREVRIQRAVSHTDGRTARARVMVLTGHDIAQLRALLRVRARPAEKAVAGEWSMELRNTRSRVATLHVVASRYVRTEGAGVTWGELRDVETLVRWLDVRGFRAPFEAWKSGRGSVRSPRTGGG